MTLNKRQRYYIGKILFVPVQIIALPFALIRVFLEFLHENITETIAGIIQCWILQGEGTVKK